VPVAREVADALHAPLDVFFVRRLPAPGHQGYVMGAIASGGVHVRSPNVVRLLGLPEDDVEAAVHAAQRELEGCERRVRDGRPAAEMSRRSVVLVDDGLADSTTLLAAVRALRARGPARVVVALPAATRELVAALRHEADDVVCARPPGSHPGPWYADAPPVSEDEVRELLAQAEAVH
jgi:predicted phosphoribosyltransferase